MTATILPKKGFPEENLHVYFYFDLFCSCWREGDSDISHLTQNRSMQH